MKQQVAILLALGLSGTSAAAEPVADLVDRADMAHRGESSAAVVSMEVKTSGYERRMKIVVWSDNRHGRDFTLVKVLGPASMRGYGTLKLGRSLKLYNPKTNHVTVVSHSMLGDSWLGSHFSHDDLVKETRLSEDFELSLQKKWSGDGVTHYRVRMSPKPRAPVPWGKVVYEIAVRGQQVMPVEAVFYRKASDRRAEKTLSFGDVRMLGGRLLPTEVTVTISDKPGEYTRIRYEKLAFDVTIPSRKFSEQSLRK